MNLDEGIKRLDEIASKLESEQCGLEEGLKLYEEGGNIAKQCYKALNEAKGKVSIIKKEIDTYKEENM